ncbi:acylphosphatase [Vibrio sp. Isolate23]|uniref:acylphosphatase n=1 Tax=Vibrio sp. Isolate23 TaxID=2908533 RepID=UPI001EFE31F2|nr:acylphosphatase [Vibrio sp. Isolate23]MCG9682387.1 acylphosphatase [Vibrio sp. Isolate23]
MNQKCEKFTVSGVVQGVGFRYHTSHYGMKLGLTGYARNLNNGDVEVVVCGNEEQIADMAKWLEAGPKTSHVDSVVSEPMSFKPFSGFKIL